jgi:hypothetical protein
VEEYADVAANGYQRRSIAGSARLDHRVSLRTLRAIMEVDDSPAGCGKTWLMAKLWLEFSARR